jgi:hypothetical protein
MKETGPGPVLLPTNLFLNGQNPGKTRMRAPWGLEFFPSRLQFDPVDEDPHTQED